MHAIVDVHEPDSIVKELESLDVNVDVEPLKSGDYLVSDMIIERKQYGDFIGRLQTAENSVFIQLMGVVSSADELDCRPVLLLEGEWASALGWSNMSAARVVAAIAGVWKMGVSIIHVPDQKGTARFISTIAQESTDASVHAIRDTPSVPDEKYPRYLTEGFKNVGPSTAQKLLDHFGDFRSIVNASENEMQEVDGIGTATAESIYEDVRREYEE